MRIECVSHLIDLLFGTSLSLYLHQDFPSMSRNELSVFPAHAEYVVCNGLNAACTAARSRRLSRELPSDTTDVT